MTNQHLVINAVFKTNAVNDPLARAVERRCTQALERIPPDLAALPQSRIPLRRRNVVGIETLRTFLADAPDDGASTPIEEIALPAGLVPLRSLVDQIAKADTGLVMVMGKGGVGKTTVAAAVAIALASRGKRVHLTTTDPAEHLRETLPESVANLRVTHIDPKEEVRQYRERTIEAAKDSKSAEQLDLLREELRSPCYEEVAVFQAFSRVVISGRKEFVVIDTAPTGHTLLLLDTAGAYHRQLTRNVANGVHIRTPLMLLQDRDYTRILIVTLPETTPVLEAGALQDDLRRAGIEPYAWVINSSLAAANTLDPVLRSRAAAEIAEMAKVRGGLAQRAAVIPFQADEPVGAERLLALAQSS